MGKALSGELSCPVTGHVMVHCSGDSSLSPIALRKAKIVGNFGLSERNRVKKNHFVIQSTEC